MDNHEHKTVICVFAHNEENNIRATLLTILDGSLDGVEKIAVYANGCTDNTHQEVRVISKKYHQVELIILEEASKSKAWNRAVWDNKNDILLFSDADVRPQRDATKKILEAFGGNDDLALVCCVSKPQVKDVSWEQRFVGFLQIPLLQDFLCGPYYGIRRSFILSRLEDIGMKGLPSGLVGDDAFVDVLTPRKNFFVIQSSVTYTPPSLQEFCKYLARIRWQNEQIDLILSDLYDIPITNRKPILIQLKDKIKRAYLDKRSIRILPMCGKYLFKKCFAARISCEYKKLGRVSCDGSQILSRATRSYSVK